MRRVELIAADRGGVTVILLSLLAVCILVEPTFAMSSLGIGSAEPAPTSIAGPFGEMFREIARVQRDFFAQLRLALVDLKDSDAALNWLVGLSFLYGIFHAAGPGHGKAVISSYVLADRVRLRRGIVLGFASSLAQAVTAIVLVGAGWFLLRGAAISMTEAGTMLEVASYALVAAFGIFILARRLGTLIPLAVDAAGHRLEGVRRRGRAARPSSLAFATPGTFAATRNSGGASSTFSASAAIPASVCTADAEACGCGRAHMPDASTMGRPLTLASSLAAILAVGLRPCSGAIVVLTFALVNGLYLGGILSVLAMSLGTAITVSAIASLAVGARGLAMRTISGDAWHRRLAVGFELAGGASLLVIGSGLLAATLGVI